MKITKVAIAGASGLVGGQCLQKLLGNPACEEVYSLVRRSSGLRHPKLKEVVVDFADLNPKKVDAVNALFCCLGTTIKKAGSQEAFREVDYTYVLSFAEWGRSKKAKHFLVVSSLGANPKSKIFYSRTKGEMENAISKLDYEAVSIFRPSLLLGKRPEPRMLERIAEAGLAVLNPFLVGPLRNYRPIAGERVAGAMVAAAPEDAKGVRIFQGTSLRVP